MVFSIKNSLRAKEFRDDMYGVFNWMSRPFMYLNSNAARASRKVSQVYQNHKSNIKFGVGLFVALMLMALILFFPPVTGFVAGIFALGTGLQCLVGATGVALASLFIVPNIIERALRALAKIVILLALVVKGVILLPVMALSAFVLGIKMGLKSIFTDN